MTTSERLLAAAYRVYSELGFAAATTKRIAETAGVNEVTLFRHFASKEALIVAAIKHHSELMIAALENHRLPETPTNLEEELQRYLALILNALLNSKQAHRTSIGEWGRNSETDPYLLLTSDFVCEEVAQYMHRACEHGLLRQGVEPQTVAQTLLGAVFADALMRDILPHRYLLAPEETIRSGLTIFLRGVLEPG